MSTVKTIGQGEQLLKLQFKRQTKFSFRFRLYQPGTTTPIADYATRLVFLTIRDGAKGNVLYNLSIGSGIEKTDASTGQYTVTINTDDNTAESGHYRFDLISENAAGERFPHRSGPVTISDNVL